MRKTFVYKEKFSWGFLFLAAVGLAGILYAFLKPFDIRFKNLTVLEYPASKFAVIAIGILFVLYAVHKYLKMSITSGKENIIVILDDELIFRHLNGYALVSRQISFTSVEELWNQTDEDDGESIILYADHGKNRYEFFAENFGEKADFEEFKTILEIECINRTNPQAAGI